MKGQGAAVHAYLDPLGSKKLRRLLLGMKYLPQKKAISLIMRQAMRPAWQAMRNRAPVRSGRLRKSIVTLVWRRRGDWIARLGPKYKGAKRAPHAHFAELGTRGGGRTTRGRFTFPSGTGIVRTANISHGGTKGKFFVKRTLDDYGPKMQARIIEKSDKFVDNYWNKNAPR
jgi:hypothetical protein